jgi:hypothetical protein
MSLEDHIAELEKHIAKLLSSNVELLVFHEETRDEEYALAIEENKVVIERKRSEVVQLRAAREKAGKVALQRGPLPDDDDDDDMADVIDMTGAQGVSGRRL